MSSSGRRWIPSVDALLRRLPATALPRSLVVERIRKQLSQWRDAAAEQPALTLEQAVAKVAKALGVLERSRIVPVVNGTGVILHTNLGRAPLSPTAADALHAVATQYSNLEFDLETGERGRRGAYVEAALATLCGSESALIVNNCAAALVLIVRMLTAGEPKEVIISRGELVQIGGGFRVPDILQTSGAILREVGTTNQTNLDDYRRAINERTTMILRVHRSNFFMDGFVHSPPIEALATIAREAGVPLVDDIGSGATSNTTLPSPGANIDGESSLCEPTPRASLAAGATLVCFSGDKLFGGPQAGIIAGSSEWTARLKREPFFRALRCDKLVLTALQSTVEQHLHASRQTRASELMRGDVETLRARAEAIRTRVNHDAVEVVDSTARVGGGSLPRARIASVALSVTVAPLQPSAALQRMRRRTPPVIGSVQRNRVRLDLRTILPQQDAMVAGALTDLLRSAANVRE